MATVLEDRLEPVSYTHLDVYKRQSVSLSTPSRPTAAQFLKHERYRYLRRRRD